MLNKNNKKEISAIQDLIEAKVYVNPERQAELLALKERLWALPLDQLPGGATCELLCINLSDAVEEALRSSLPGWTLQVERICDDPDAPEYKEDRKRFVKLFSGKRLEGAGVAAIVHELRSQDDELSVLDKRVIALSLLSRLPVISCCCSSADALPAAAAATGDTWPVFFTPHPHEDVRPMAEWLRKELPRVRALSAAITEEVQARTAHLGKVNVPLHFLKRGAVALVPFGVLTVNTLGIVRLMANMLQLAGMRGDTSANKALGLLGAENAALVSAVDSLGDVYSFAVFATVLGDLQGMGFVEAAEAMDVVDGLTLGSIGVVTGAVSALGAYMSRPVMVRSAGQFLASLQTIYALNPGMRREGLERKTKKKRHGGRHKGAGGGAAGDADDKEELRGLLQRSTAGGKAREQARGGKKKGRKGAQAHTELEERHAAAAAVLAGRAESEVADEEEEAQSGSGSEDGSEEGQQEVGSRAGGEEASAAASAAAAAAVSAAAAAEDVATAAEQAAVKAEEEALAAEAEADAASVAASSASATDAAGLGTGKLTREEKKQLALARRAAAAEAKAKAADAKAAAKAAAAASKGAEKERLAQEKAAAKEAAKEAKAAAAADKAAAKERKAEERAAAKEELKAAKAAIAAAKAAEKERLAMEKAAAREAAKAAKEEAKAAKAGAKASEPSTSSIVGPEAWEAAPVAPAPAATKVRWWQRAKKAEVAGAAAGAAVAAAADGGIDVGSSGGSGVSGSDESGWGLAVLGGAIGGSAGEDGSGDRDVADAAARDERMGLDAETRAALAQFLSLEEEEVYGAEGSLEGSGEGEAPAAAVASEGLAGVSGGLHPLGSCI